MIKRVSIIILFLLVVASPILSQSELESIKRKAIIHLNAKRYGEAIDLLNKYVSANARDAEGYNLRGMCYYNREQYEYAITDLRRAVRLDQSKEEYKKNLKKIIEKWYPILYRKIEGYKREIAIDKTNPFNYLEIGKSYRWLEEWEKAEIWYDEYLKRDDNASPDEIIRYTIILTKLKHIRKGEQILKKWVEKYPEDWRLWSRYGYFTLWLGKYKIAQEAFTNALKFKPFFKEAMDGLDLAKKEGYITQMGIDDDGDRRQKRKIYPVDRYYWLTKKHPENVDYKLALIRELLKVDRLKEASDQRDFLGKIIGDKEEYKIKYEYISTKIDSLQKNKIEDLTSKLKVNPNDYESVIKLASSYATNQQYDEAIEILVQYMENNKGNVKDIAKFRYAQYSAWNHDFDNALTIMKELTAKEPKDLEYKLLRSQIEVWQLGDLDLAERNLQEILKEKPESIATLTTLVQLYCWEKDFESAKKYLDISKKLSPNNDDVILTENLYNTTLQQAKDEKIFKIRVAAQDLMLIPDYKKALEKYDEYLSKIEQPTRSERIEYADILYGLKRYDEAIEIYGDVYETNDISILKRLANSYLWNKDSTKALETFNKLKKEEPLDFSSELLYAKVLQMNNYTDKADSILDKSRKKIDDSLSVNLVNNNMFDTKLFIGDIYAENKNYSEAEDVYNEIIDEATGDTIKIKIAKQRIDWLPSYGFGYGLLSIIDPLLPNHIGISPFTSFYKDNQDFAFFTVGSRLEIGLNSFLGIGGDFTHYSFYSDYFPEKYRNVQLNKAVGSLNIIFSKSLIMQLKYGIINIGKPGKEDTYGGNIDYKGKFEAGFSYTFTDSRTFLYSPKILYTKIDADIYQAYIRTDKTHKIYVSAFYKYFTLSDKNKGNDFSLRLGKRFLDKGYLGYEYYFVDYGRIDKLYYSPQEFHSHSIWGEIIAYQEENLTVNVGGKVGYSPTVDFILSEIYSNADYKPFDFLFIRGELKLGRSFRYDSKYDFISAYISAYLSVF